MEFIKYNEAYSIIDDTMEGWAVSGQAFKEVDGSIKITFSANKGDEHIGSCNYNINIDNTVNANRTYSIPAKEVFEAYAENTVNTILKHFGIE